MWVFMVYSRALSSVFGIFHFRLDLSNPNACVHCRQMYRSALERCVACVFGGVAAKHGPLFCMIPVGLSTVVSFSSHLFRQSNCNFSVWEGFPFPRRKSVFSSAKCQFSWCHKGRWRKRYFSGISAATSSSQRKGGFLPYLRFSAVKQII